MSGTASDPATDVETGSAPGSAPGAVSEPRPLGVYVHLPWCVARCPYCDFNAHALRGALPEARYVDALAADLAFHAPHVSGRTVQTIFFGGGTPSLFSAGAIARILDGIRDVLHVNPDAEITLEANPGTVDERYFAGFRRAGVNRLSLGVQSFDDSSLAALGRIHDGATARRAVTAAADAGFENLNVDLMFALPGQSPPAAAQDVAIACDGPANHLSWYQLTIEPNTPFHARPPRLPDEDTAARIQSVGENVLAQNGYERYEVSAWTRDSRPCRHNLNYWRFGDYLGLGAGAHGKLTGADGRPMRYAKKRHPRVYLSTAGTPECLDVHAPIETHDLPFEYLLNALRLDEGFSVADFKRATGLEPGQAAGAAFAEAARRGLLARTGDRFAPTSLGRRFLNDLQALFLPVEPSRREARGATMEP